MYTAMAFPLSSGFHKSLMTPPPMARGALAPIPLRKRNIVSCVFVRANPQPTFHARKKRFPRSKTGTRPLISDIGARMSGPKPMPSRTTERTICISKELLMSKSEPIAPIAGEIIVPDSGDRNVNEETMSVAVHRLPVDQFLGFSGSSGPFQVTCARSL